MKLGVGVEPYIAPNGRPFVWGQVIGKHVVGEYTILEAFKERAVAEGTEIEREVSYYVYIGDDDTNRSYHSLDAALAGAIAIKHDGLNTRADTYFLRAIEAEPLTYDEHERRRVVNGLTALISGGLWSGSTFKRLVALRELHVGNGREQNGQART